MSIKRKICWKQFLLLIVLQTVAILLLTPVFRHWQSQTDNWCVRYAANGSHKFLYGGVCRK